MPSPFRTITGLTKTLGQGIPQQFPIQLDPAPFEGAIVYADNGELRYSDGNNWLPLGTGPQGTTGATGPAGSQGIQGDYGPGFTIIGSVPDVDVIGDPQATLNAAFPTANVGEGVIDDADDELWIYDGTNWVNIGSFRGVQGFPGNQGIQGVQGPEGDKGVQGYRGLRGFQGERGIQGPQGVQGRRGFQGVQGRRGVQGYQGVQGDFGVQGNQGLQGRIGDQGVQGVQGNLGIQGNQGLQGRIGDQGVQGVQGDFGVQGNQGLQGDLGPQGPQGTTGIQGNQGLQGLQGPQGLQGVIGPEGLTGGLTFLFNYDYNNNGVTTDPGSSFFVTSVDDLQAAGTFTITIDDETAVDGSGSADISVILADIQARSATPKAYILLRQRDDNASDMEFTWVEVTSLTDNAGYWTIDCAYVDGIADWGTSIGTFGNLFELNFNIPGQTGSQGVQGPQGLQGRQGTQGPQGTQGTQGPQGLQGTQGTQGPQGTKGIQGNQGIQGESIQGERGPQGPVGIQGDFGIQGVQGSQGTGGDGGAQGPQGVQGIQGWQGWGGGLSFEFEFNSSTTSGVFPGLNNFKFNNATITNVTEIWLDDLTGNGRRIDQVINFLNSVYIDPTRPGAHKGTIFIRTPRNAAGEFEFVVFKYTNWVWSPSGSGQDWGNFDVEFVERSRLEGTDATPGTSWNWAASNYGTTATFTFIPSGSEGFQGIQGPQGTIGIQGDLGFQGSSGNLGAQGIQGTTGDDGIQGPQGVQGLPGAGSQGIQGVQGTTGLQGSLAQPANTYVYNYDSSSRVIADPGNGNFRIEANPISGASPSTPFEFALDAFDTGNGAGQHNILSYMESIAGSVKGFIEVQNVDPAATNLSTFLTIQDVINEGNDVPGNGWWRLQVSNVDGSTDLDNVVTLAGGETNFYFRITAASPGVQGPTGPQGVQGTQGDAGEAGGFGGVTFDYTWDQGTGALGAFDVGKLRVNNATYSSANLLYIHERDDFSVNIETYLRTIDDSTSTIKGHFKISEKADPSQFILYTISGLTETGSVFSVDCAYVSGSATSFAQGEDVVITFARTGDSGDAGLPGAQGAQGLQGVQGVQGLQGATGDGAQGVQGTTGSDGVGIDGQQGVQGVQGTQGEQGDDGAQGPVGFQGPGGVGAQGIQGVQGAIGPQGIAALGVDGIQGNQGVQGEGIQGIQGPQGTTGEDGQGSVGPQGIQGVQGTIGQQGVQGLQGTGGVGAGGFQGLQGLQGLQGDEGPDGPLGPQGIQGFQGVQGAVGSTANQGAQGPQGSDGPQGLVGAGAQGPQGTQGVQGTDGEGFGIQGYQGPQGAQGPQGTQGESGVGIGIQGTQGPQGPQGPQGSDGEGVGIQGTQGPQGADGPQGVSGEGSPGVQGIQGPQGFQGPQGTTGSATEGQPGVQGFRGFQGFTGGEGAGIQGAIGFQGPQGTEGPEGSGGEAIQGIQGVQGPQGFEGSPGSQGFRGFQGNQGVQGPGGTVGEATQGAQGPQGPLGATGGDGAQGPTGGVAGGQDNPADITSFSAAIQNINRPLIFGNFEQPTYLGLQDTFAVRTLPGNPPIVPLYGAFHYNAQDSELSVENVEVGGTFLVPSGSTIQTEAGASLVDNGGLFGASSGGFLDATNSPTKTAGLFTMSSSSQMQFNNNVELLLGSSNQWTLNHNGTDLQLTASVDTSDFEIRDSSTSIAFAVDTSTLGIAVGGNVSAGGDVITSSDERLKSDIENVNDALETVLKMRGVTFLKEGHDSRSLGLIAQEVEKLLPEVVTENKDGYLGVSYGSIVAILIEAIKEQQKQIDALK